MTFEEDCPEWFKQKYKLELETKEDAEYDVSDTEKGIIKNENRFWIKLSDVKRLQEEQKSKVREANIKMHTDAIFELEIRRQRLEQEKIENALHLKPNIVDGMLLEIDNTKGWHEAKLKELELTSDNENWDKGFNAGTNNAIKMIEQFEKELDNTK